MEKPWNTILVKNQLREQTKILQSHQKSGIQKDHKSRKQINKLLLS